FIFPSDLVIEKSNSYSLWADENKREQIVRYQVDKLHGKTNFIQGSLGVTPIKKGSYVMKIFVKGENIKAKYRTITFLVS
ncbi:MAG: hypothetical protein ACREL1_03980, partial [bacterium]